MLPLFSTSGSAPGGERIEAQTPHSTKTLPEQIQAFADTLRRVLDRADDDDCTPAEAADRLAEERIAAVGAIGLVRTATPREARPPG